MPTKNSRRILRLVPSEIAIEGGGFEVRRPFPTRSLDHVDPFLLLDEAGPIIHRPGEEGGLPDHPHRGFETLTYVLEGAMESHDTTGFREIIDTGEVEWTTAGRGIIHGGGPTPEMKIHGGSTRAFQIWVNLPANKKMIPPQSQRVAREAIPEITGPDQSYHVRVLGGEVDGVVGPIRTTWPVTYLHYTAPANSWVEVPTPVGHRMMVYVFAGAVLIGGERVATSHLAILDDGDHIEVSVPAEAGPTQFLVLGGAEIREPVARYGPFVMNTRDEVFQAFDDYNAGLFSR